MDFVVAKSADPDELTHNGISSGSSLFDKNLIRGFWYTKGIQRINISYIRVQKSPCFTTEKFQLIKPVLSIFGEFD